MTFHIRDLVRFFKGFGAASEGQVLAYNATTQRPEWRDASAGGPTDADILTGDYTVTTAGEKVLEVTAPEDGLYLVETMLHGVINWGTGDAFNGAFKAYMVADMEPDQNNASMLLTTLLNVSGLTVYERDHSTKVYNTGTDVLFSDSLHRHNMYAGTLNATYQRGVVYLEAGGKVELYCKDDNTNGVSVGGFHKLVAGNKIQITKLAGYTIP